MNTTLKFAVGSLIGATAISFSLGALAQDITGAGATFPAPLYAKWASEYNKATGIKVNYQSVGSGAGIKQIDSKTVAFGASDMPLKDDELAKKGQIQFPTVIGGVVPVINVKGIEPLASSNSRARCWATSSWARSPSGPIRPSRH
jgi:phosphate transport system substrate-binding protein